MTRLLDSTLVLRLGFGLVLRYSLLAGLALISRTLLDTVVQIVRLGLGLAHGLGLGLIADCSVTRSNEMTRLRWR